MAHFSEWIKRKEDEGALGLSVGVHARLFRHGKTATKKAWDPREANLLTYQVSHNTGAQLADRIERVKAERFFKEPMEPPTVPQYLKADNSQIRHLSTDNPRPAPFAFLRRPLPPPFPLPTFEESTISLDEPSPTPSEVRKIPSIERNLSKLPEPRVNLKQFDAEREFFQPVQPKEGGLKININSKMDKKKKSVPQLAQQTKEWEKNLRAKSKKSVRIKYSEVEFKPTISKKSQEPEPEPMPFKNYTEDVIAKKWSSAQKPAEKHEAVKKDEGYDTSLFYQMTPRMRHIPNRTILAAETGMDNIQHIARQGPRFPDYPTRMAFYIQDGIPTALEPKPLGNTFGAAKTVRNPFKKPGRRTRSFSVDMVGFKDRYISFEINGNVISVSGLQPKDKTHNKRHVVESLTLPPGLTLNKIRVNREYTGRIIFQELSEF